MNTDTNGSAEATRLRVTHHDPVLDSIFSALGVDEGYLDGDAQDPGIPIESQGWLDAADADSADEPGDTRPWILHVDDDTDLSNALKLRLEGFGVSVVQAFHGIDGVRHAFNRPADAVILDYQMPHGDGEYVLKRLKQCEATRHIPIIVLTGRRDQGLEQRMLHLGADRFLNKPVRLDAMLNELRNFVPLKEVRGEACLIV